MRYCQREQDKYRTEYYYTWETENVYSTNSSGDRVKTGTKQVQVRHSRDVFDHHEYYITRQFNGADYIVTIQAESKKHKDKIVTSTIYTTSTFFNDAREGSVFRFTDKIDSYDDRNNTRSEMDRQWYQPFNMSAWAMSHNIPSDQVVAGYQ